jgi:hypothetical protein
MYAEHTNVSRRAFLATAGGAAVGFEIARLPNNVAQAADVLPTLPPLPWPYPAGGLNVEDLRRTAYKNYKTTTPGCAFCTTQTLIKAIGDGLAKEGAASNPWPLLPSGLYKYANGGVVGWGTICGALNGAIAVMDLLGVHGTLGEPLMDYFSTAELPTSALVGWTPGVAGLMQPLQAIPATVSHSPLCHNSASHWAAVAGVPVSSALKTERCVRLVADIVAKTVDLLNINFSGGKVTWVMPATYAGCYDCHTKPETVPSQQGKMDCQECHSTMPPHGYNRKRNGR